MHCSLRQRILWPPYVIRQAIICLPYSYVRLAESRCKHYFHPVSSFFFFSLPNLSRRRLDVYHTSTQWYGLSANLGCMSEMCCTRLAENTGHKTSPCGHHRTTMSGCIFATKACIDNRKNTLNSNTCFTCTHNMANFGPLAAEVVSLVWGTLAIFNQFRVLASLLQRRRSTKAN